MYIYIYIHTHAHTLYVIIIVVIIIYDNSIISYSLTCKILFPSVKEIRGTLSASKPGGEVPVKIRPFIVGFHSGILARTSSMN